MTLPYEELIPDVKREWELTGEATDKEYYPHVSVGWDNNPRYFRYHDPVKKVFMMPER